MNKRKIKVLNPVSKEIVEGYLTKPIELPDISGEIKLEDETILNFRVNIDRITRIPDQWDSDGNPFYVIQSSNSVMIIATPEDLREENK